MKYQNKRKEDRRITLKMYLNYHLQIREDNFNLLFWCDILFHQFMVNKYIDNETNKFQYLYNNQDLFRKESYKGLQDSIIKNMNLSDIGKITILPASHYGNSSASYTNLL